MKNLLLIVVDCARAEKTVTDLPEASAATRRSARLPFLDRLRSLGTTWTCYCSVSSTTTPNFGTMFTGLTPRQHGILEHSHHALNDVPTLATILRERGYFTYAEVTGPLVPESGLDRGFDHYRARSRREYLHAGLAQRLAALLGSLKEPWFLCLHLWEAHTPYQNPPPFHAPSFGTTEYDRALSAVDHGLDRVFPDLDLSRTTVVCCGDHGERLEADYARNLALGGSEEEVLACYRRFVAEHPPPVDFDAWFRTIHAELGEARARIYAHNVLGHGFHLTEDLVRVPLVIADGDRCPPGATRGELRSQLDLFATLLDLAGVDPGEVPGAGAGRGRSLLEGPGSEAIYLEANGSGGKAYASRCFLRGARSRDWKYWRLEGATREHRVLWHLADDPREIRDVASEHPDVVQELDRFTSDWVDRGPAGAPAALSAGEEEALEKTLRGLGYL